MQFPGEDEAIESVLVAGEKYGFGNMIHHLKNAWSASLQEKWTMSKKTSDAAAGHICAWCNVDSRTGKKVKP